MMSSAVPSMPASGWWIMMRALGRAKRLPGGAGGQQHGAHRGRLADAIGGHVAVDELHRVVDRQAGADAAARRIDVQVDVGLGVVRLQEQQLGDDGVGHFVVDLRSRGRRCGPSAGDCRCHRPLFAAAFLDDVRNQWHGWLSLPGTCVAGSLLLVVRSFSLDRRLLEDVVDQAVGLGLFGGHEEIAVGVFGDALDRLAGVAAPGSR